MELRMAAFEHHCEQSRAAFGQPFEEVHQWLDEFAGSLEYGFRHRRKRHHEDGIRQVITLFGAEAGKAARLHIITDLKEEGWSKGDPFPRDEADYVNLGLY
jgi:hypothetical protein